MKALDVVGLRFGKLFVEREIEPTRSPNGQRFRIFLCHCDCGRSIKVRTGQLRRGQKSCGCDRRRTVTHGHARLGSNTPTYRIWAGMVQRCTNPEQPAFKHYGGRGVQIDPSWMDYARFLQDMGERPAGLTLERRDVNGDYTLSNCVWASQRQQARNKRSNKFIEIDGSRHLLVDAASQLGISHSAISSRITRGWTLEAAMTTPRMKTWSRHKINAPSVLR